MKKVLCVLAAVAMVAFFSTSCNKKCTCKTYRDGKVVDTVTDDNPDTHYKCSEYTTLVTVNGKKNGLKCQ